MDALVLAAGKGTRMRGLCDDVPKCMLPLGNVPVLEHVIAGLELSRRRYPARGAQRSWASRFCGTGRSLWRSATSLCRETTMAA